MVPSSSKDGGLQFELDTRKGEEKHHFLPDSRSDQRRIRIMETKNMTKGRQLRQNPQGKAKTRWQSHDKRTCKCAVCLQLRGELKSSWYNHNRQTCACAVCKQSRGVSRSTGFNQSQQKAGAEVSASCDSELQAPKTRADPAGRLGENFLAGEARGEQPKEFNQGLEAIRTGADPLREFEQKFQASTGRDGHPRESLGAVTAGFNDWKEGDKRWQAEDARANRWRECEPNVQRGVSVDPLRNFNKTVQATAARADPPKKFNQFFEAEKSPVDASKEVSDSLQAPKSPFNTPAELSQGFQAVNSVVDVPAKRSWLLPLEKVELQHSMSRWKPLSSTVSHSPPSCQWSSSGMYLSSEKLSSSSTHLVQERIGNHWNGLRSSHLGFHSPAAPWRAHHPNHDKPTRPQLSNAPPDVENRVTHRQDLNLLSDALHSGRRLEMSHSSSQLRDLRRNFQVIPGESESSNTCSSWQGDIVGSIQETLGSSIGFAESPLRSLLHSANLFQGLLDPVNAPSEPYSDALSRFGQNTTFWAGSSSSKTGPGSRCASSELHNLPAVAQWDPTGCQPHSQKCDQSCDDNSVPRSLSRLPEQWGLTGYQPYPQKCDQSCDDNSVPSSLSRLLEQWSATGYQPYPQNSEQSFSNAVPSSISRPPDSSSWQPESVGSLPSYPSSTMSCTTTLSCGLESQPRTVEPAGIQNPSGTGDQSTTGSSPAPKESADSISLRCEMELSSPRVINYFSGDRIDSCGAAHQRKKEDRTFRDVEDEVGVQSGALNLDSPEEVGIYSDGQGGHELNASDSLKVSGSFDLSGGEGEKKQANHAKARQLPKWSRLIHSQYITITQKITIRRRVPKKGQQLSSSKGSLDFLCDCGVDSCSLKPLCRATEVCKKCRKGLKNGVQDVKVQSTAVETVGKSEQLQAGQEQSAPLGAKDGQVKMGNCDKAFRSVSDLETCDELLACKSSPTTSFVRDIQQPIQTTYHRKLKPRMPKVEDHLATQEVSTLESRGESSSSVESDGICDERALARQSAAAHLTIGSNALRVDSTKLPTYTISESTAQVYATKHHMGRKIHRPRPVLRDFVAQIGQGHQMRKRTRTEIESWSMGVTACGESLTRQGFLDSRHSTPATSTKRQRYDERQSASLVSCVLKSLSKILRPTDHHLRLSAITLSLDFSSYATKHHMGRKVHLPRPVLRGFVAQSGQGHQMRKRTRTEIESWTMGVTGCGEALTRQGFLDSRPSTTATSTKRQRYDERQSASLVSCVLKSLSKILRPTDHHLRQSAITLSLDFSFWPSVEPLAVRSAGTLLLDLPSRCRSKCTWSVRHWQMLCFLRLHQLISCATARRKPPSSGFEMSRGCLVLHIEKAADSGLLSSCTLWLRRGRDRTRSLPESTFLGISDSFPCVQRLGLEHSQDSASRSVKSIINDAGLVTHSLSDLKSCTGSSNVINGDDIFLDRFKHFFSIRLTIPRGISDPLHRCGSWSSSGTVCANPVGDCDEGVEKVAARTGQSGDRRHVVPFCLPAHGKEDSKAGIRLHELSIRDSKTFPVAHTPKPELNRVSPPVQIAQEQSAFTELKKETSLQPFSIDCFQDLLKSVQRGSNHHSCRVSRTSCSRERQPSADNLCPRVDPDLKPPAKPLDQSSPSLGPGNPSKPPRKRGRPRKRPLGEIVGEVSSLEKRFSAERKECDTEQECEVVQSPITRLQHQRDSFKTRLEVDLRRPFSWDELEDLDEKASVRKPLLKLRETRQRALHVSTKTDGKSYLDGEPELAKLVNKARTLEEKLMHLRTFFFWVQNACTEGSFKPWESLTDNDDCFEVFPEKRAKTEIVAHRVHETQFGGSTVQSHGAHSSITSLTTDGLKQPALSMVLRPKKFEFTPGLRRRKPRMSKAPSPSPFPSPSPSVHVPVLLKAKEELLGL